MQRLLPWLTDTLARLIGLLFALSTSLYLLALAAMRMGLDASFYDRMLEEVNAVERARAMVMQAGLNQALGITTGGRVPAAILELPANTWEAMADELIPGDWLSDQVHRAVHSWLAWMHSDDPLPGFRIELDGVVDRLRQPGGTLALLPLLENLPDCPPNMTLPATAGVYVPCLPVDGNVEGLARRTASALADELPTAIDFPSLFALGVVTPEIVPAMDRVRHAARWADAALRLWGDANLLLLALYLLLTVRSWLQVAERLILPLGSAGGVSLVLGPLVLGAVTWATAFASFPAEQILLPGPWSLLRDLVGYLMRAVAIRLSLSAAAMLLVAGLAWGVGRIARAVQRRRARAIPPRRGTRVRRQFG